MPFHAVDDGTWRIFSTQRAAQNYAAACWVRTLVLRSQQGDGTLFNVVTRTNEPMSDTIAGVDLSSLAAIEAWVAGLNTNQLNSLRAKLNQLPWLARDSTGTLVEVGFTTWWSEPLQTAAGTWAVVCWEGGGVSRPALPTMLPVT